MTSMPIRESEPVSVEAQIRELFAALLQAPLAEIHDGTKPNSLARWDSMQHLILVSGFEEEFGIDVDPMEAVEMYEGFGAFRRIIQEKLEGGR
jgi:acyl carrier protein